LTPRRRRWSSGYVQKGAQRAPRLMASTYQVVAPLGFLLLALTNTEARAQTRGGLGASLDLLNLLYLVVVEPLLPLLAGAGLFMLTRSHLIAAGLSALGFGAWGALYFSRLSLDGPLSGALSPVTSLVRQPVTEKREATRHGNRICSASRDKWLRQGRDRALSRPARVVARGRGCNRQLRRRRRHDGVGAGRHGAWHLGGGNRQRRP
jgi:hypothetical protein